MEILNLFDIIILSIIFISCLFAFFKGFVVSFLSVGNWLASLVITFLAFPIVSSILSKYIGVKLIVGALSSIGVFFTVSLIIGLVNLKLANFLNRYVGGMIDRILGVGFGLVRGLLVCSVIFFVIDLISRELKIGDNPEKPGPAFFAESMLYDTLRKSKDLVITYLPYDVTEDGQEAIGQIKQSTRQRLDYISQKEKEEGKVINKTDSRKNLDKGNDISNEKLLMQLFEENIGNTINNK